MVSLLNENEELYAVGKYSEVYLVSIYTNVNMSIGNFKKIKSVRLN